MAAFVVWLAVAGALGACKHSSRHAASTHALRIAVIPKGTTHEYWKAVHAGAVKAAREFGVDVIWKGPVKEDDLKAQIDLVQSFTAQGVSGIVLAPLNDRALVESVKGAERANIPVVIFDSQLSGDKPVSFVATDNEAAGRLAGKRMARLLGGKGNVVMLRYEAGSASTHHREQGFLAGLGGHPAIHVVSDNQYGGATTESAHAASESLLLAQDAAHGKVDGVFCPNESTTFGMLLALEQANLAGKIKFIGFDSSQKLVEGVRDKKIDGLVVQDPFSIGYLSVKTMVEHLRGQKVQARIDTGAHFVTAANMADPKIHALLEPDVKRWLGE